MNKIICICLLLMAANISAQKPNAKAKKTANPLLKKLQKIELEKYAITEKGDTINRVFTNGIKEGLWIEKQEANFGEDAILKTGEYKNNFKFGKWRAYSNGIITSLETFNHDVRDGEVRYFEDGFITIRGQYKANKIPERDTVAVMTPGQVDSMVELVDLQRSLKDGIWIYYKPNGKIAFKEYYYLDNLVQTQNMESADITDPDYVPDATIKYPHTGAKSADPFAKINKRKSSARFTDFPEDGKGVKPNKRKR